VYSSTGVQVTMYRAMTLRKRNRFQMNYVFQWMITSFPAASIPWIIYGCRLTAMYALFLGKKRLRGCQYLWKLLCIVFRHL